MADPLVSVLITTYNHEKYFRSAIEGCLMQKTSFPIEIIIHDDASTDNTAEIIKEYAEKYSDIIIPILQEKNQRSQGVKYLQKFILPVSQGKYIARCEGDDYWIDPHKLEKQITVMENDPSISMCFTAVKREYVDGSGRDRVIRYHRGDHFFPPKDIILRGGSFSDLATVVTYKDIYDDLPEWYSLSSSGDVALNLLAMIKGKVFYLDDVTAVYRIFVPGSWTERNKDPENRLKHVQKKLIMYDAFDNQTGYVYHQYVRKIRSKTITSFLSTIDGHVDTQKFFDMKLTIRERITVIIKKIVKLIKSTKLSKIQIKK